MRIPFRIVTLLVALTTTVVAQGPRLFSREWYAQFSGAYSQPVEPFRVVGNIYYVGALNIASYLIATPQNARRTFRKLKAEREPDIVLVGHPQAMFAGTMERMRKGERPHPLLNGADAWTRQLAVAEADFERRVVQEQPRR